MRFFSRPFCRSFLATSRLYVANSRLYIATSRLDGATSRFYVATCRFKIACGRFLEATCRFFFLNFFEGFLACFCLWDGSFLISLFRSDLVFGLPSQPCCPCGPWHDLALLRFE